jgi:hypothetical protein
MFGGAVGVRLFLMGGIAKIAKPLFVVLRTPRKIHCSFGRGFCSFGRGFVVLLEGFEVILKVLEVLWDRELNY